MNALVERDLRGALRCQCGKAAQPAPLANLMPSSSEKPIHHERAASTDLQLLGMNFCLRCRYNCSPCGTRSIGDGVNHPPPADMAIFINSPRCAAAFVNLHSPVVAVGRKCEHERDCGREHHAGEHSNQKRVSRYLIPHIPLICPSKLGVKLVPSRLTPPLNR